MIRLLAGLGNPGAEYEATRHNAGFWFIDEAARALKVSLAVDRGYHGLVARANTDHGPVWLLQPMTYMNLSGQSVAALARFFKIAPDEILVVHDELDLPPGQVKLKRGGSHAGHNGLKDIHARLGSADYWRLRLGIGHPGVKAEVVNHVLRKPPLAERQAIDEAIASSLKALDLLLAGEMDKATVRLHAKPPRPKPPRPPALPGAEPGRAAAGAAGTSSSAPATASSPAPFRAAHPSADAAPAAGTLARRPPSEE
jgi:PTH1 family peptidyl-tRNA hydrolase